MSDQSLATGCVRSVLGDLSPDSLGQTNYHEHLFQVSPLLPGDELTNEALSAQEAGLLKASGFDAMVDATPMGLGRNPHAVARISAERDIAVIATTGRHREAHYGDDHWVRGLNETALTEAFVRDVTRSMPGEDGQAPQHKQELFDGTPVRAGLLKAGIDYWKISPFEHETVSAVAAAHLLTGAPIMIHIEHGTATHEILDLLEKLSVPSSSVALAHLDRNLDPGLHVSLIERGAYLGYDGMARAKSHSDHALVELTRLVVERVGATNIVIGGDVARASRYVAYGGMPGLAYLGDQYLPRLKKEIGDPAVSQILVNNPATWLTWVTPQVPQN